MEANAANVANHRARFQEKVACEKLSKYTVPNREEYGAMLATLCGSERSKSFYYLREKFAVVEVGGVKKIVKSRKNEADPLHYLAVRDELFDIIYEAHVSTGHGGEKNPKIVLDDKYANIPMKMVILFLAACETCQRKKPLPNKGIVVKPIRSRKYCDRGQVDLINMESTPSGKLVQILNYQDHFTKFLVLKPLTSKRAAEVAYHLIDIFTFMGAPSILQSDNGREFVADVVSEMKSMWPNLQIVHGRARHPQSQGSVERSNADVKQMLIAWTIDNNTTSWADGLRFVQLQKNSSPHRNLQNTSPFEILFGQKPRLGLQKSVLPAGVLAHITTEEQLEAALREIHGMEAAEEQAEAAEEQAVAAGEQDQAAEEQAVAAGEQDQAAGEQEQAAGEQDQAAGEQEQAAGEQDQADETEERATGIADAFSKHIKTIRACRDKAASGQAKSRKEMLEASNAILHPLSVGDCVLLPVSEFDRGRLDCRNIPGVVYDITASGLYKVATKHGMIEAAYSRNQLQKADSQLTSLSETSNIMQSFRKIASLHSATGGQRFAKCSCTTKCDSRRCACRKSGTLCHSHCHPRNGKCKNK